MGVYFAETVVNRNYAPQNQAMLGILAAHCKSCTQDMRTKLALLSLSSRRCFPRFQLVYKIVHNVNCLDQLKNYLVKRSQLHNWKIS